MLKTATCILVFATACCATARAAVPFLPPMTLYVANEGQIDGSGSIALSSGPFSLVLTPDGKWAFVWTESATASFEEVRLPDGASVAMIPPAVSTELEGLAITPNGQLILDVDYDAQTVWLYSTHAQSQIGSITGFSYPEGLALSPDGGVGYVTNNNCAAFPCTGPGFVTAVSTRTHAVLGTVTVGINPQFIAAFSGPGVVIGK